MQLVKKCRAASACGLAEQEAKGREWVWAQGVIQDSVAPLAQSKASEPGRWMPGNLAAKSWYLNPEGTWPRHHMTRQGAGTTGCEETWNLEKGDGEGGGVNKRSFGFCQRTQEQGGIR